ncbi:MAG: N-acetyltransferase [Candidatus Woesebacteria bacterium]
MIRKLTKADVRKYKQLRLLALTTDPDAYFATYAEEERRDEWSIATEIAAHAFPFGYFGWFDTDQHLRAYIQIAPAYFAKTNHTADVYNLYVHPEFRRQGIAKELLLQVLSHLRERKSVEILYLSVMQSNSAALHMYERLGFTTVGIKKAAVKLGSQYENEVLLQLEL